MTRIEECRRAMKDAEAAYVQAARERFEGARRGSREVETRYHEKLESLVAAYDSMRLASPRHSTL